MYKHEIIVEDAEAPRDIGSQVCGKVLIAIPKPRDVTSVEVVFQGYVGTIISDGDDSSYTYKEILFE